MFPRHVTSAALSTALLFASLGCDKATSTDAGQWYHAYLVTDDDEEIPFFLRMPEDCENHVATIVNGDEQLEADCRRSPVGFVVEFPVYATQLEVWFKPDGTLTGHWCRELSTGREPIWPLKAEPVSAPDPAMRFPVGSEDVSTDVAGVWRAEFDDKGVSKAVFVQDAAGVVTGSIEVPSEYGDLRFLAGNVRGERLQLSTFDGQHGFLVDGEIRPDGTMLGRWLGSESQHPFVAERDEDFEMPDPLARIAFTPGVKRLELDALQDTKFDGKAVIVEIFGTWCPNCNDHAPALVELHRKYRTDGLEVLGLAYEYGFDAEYNERRVEEFKKRHGVEFDIVIADATLEELTTEGLDGLRPIEGVPVTIFLNRDHTVHAIYSGFSGPATGEAHGEAKAKFERLTAEILNGI